MNKPPAPASAYPQYEVAAGDKQGFEKLDKAAVVLLEGDRFGQWLVAACNVRPEHAHMLITQEVTGSTLISSPDVAAFLDRKFPAIPAGRQEAIVAKVAALKATNTGPGGVNPRPTTPPHRSPPDVNEGTPAADAKSNLASTTLIEISDPSIEDLRDVLKLYPYTVSTSWSLAHLQHPIPNSHRPIVEMLCCYVFDRQQQRTVQALATALGLAEIDVQRSLQKCHAALQSLQQHQDENLESDWRAQLYEPLVVELAFSRRHCLRGATIRVLQEDSRKYFNPDFIVCQLDTPDDLVYNQVKAQFTERAHRLPSCVMEFKKDDVLRDIYKVGAMQLLIMQHQEHWLKRVAEQLKANGKSGLDTIRTWLRLPYCIGVHMDRDGCTFAYLSPDANGVEQRAWLCFPLINWRDGGLLRIARIFMELELVNRSYWDSIARIMHHLNPALPLPQRPSLPEEINQVDTSKQPKDDPFQAIGTFAVTRELPPLQRLSAKHDVFFSSANSVVLKRHDGSLAARRECAMLLRVQQYPQFYVHLRSTFCDEEGAHWLEMDRLPGSGLGGIADNNTLRAVFRALLRSLRHLHTVPQLIHGDIKPANLFYNRTSKSVILMDFGSAKPGPLYRGVIAGTAGYEAPEAIKGVACYKSDVYSAACTVIGSLVGKHSIMTQVISSGTKSALTLQNQLRASGWPASQTLSSLLCGMLQADLVARLTAQQALSHVYFSEKEN